MIIYRIIKVARLKNFLCESKQLTIIILILLNNTVKRIKVVAK